VALRLAATPIFTRTAAATPNTAVEADIAFAAGDYRTALRDWQQLAGENNASAMLGVGVLYDTGHGVPQDFATALSWYRRAAEAASAVGAFNVAVMYDAARGTPPDRSEAITWYKRAAAKGFGRAAYNLGVIYRDGDGVARDRALAIRYFTDAARLNIPAARGNLVSLGAVPPRPLPQSAPLALPPPALPQAAPPPASAPPNQATRTQTSPTQTSPTQAPSIQAPSIQAPSTQAPSTQAPPASPSGAPPQVPPPPAVAGKPPSQPSSPPREEPVVADRFEPYILAGQAMPPEVARTFVATIPKLMQRSSTGDHQAELNLGYAYQQGLGVHTDLVLAYIYDVQASLSPHVPTRAAAVQNAVDVVSHMSAEQQDIARTTLIGR
jgi:TPR repeat protein